MSDVNYSMPGLLLTWPVLHVLFICPFWSGLYSSINLARVFLTEAQLKLMVIYLNELWGKNETNMDQYIGNILRY